MFFCCNLTLSVIIVMMEKMLYENYPELGPNYFRFADRQAFRLWLEQHVCSDNEVYVLVKRGKPKDDGTLYYLDAVEEALCFGWIDSTQQNVSGLTFQRFSPRKRGSPWTELNKERCRRLIRLGKMTKWGKKILPKLTANSFIPDSEVVEAIKKARLWSKFRSFPKLYQRIRLYNVAFYKSLDQKLYQRALNSLLAHTKKGEMYGEWNDYGRLLEEQDNNCLDPQ